MGGILFREEEHHKKAMIQKLAHIQDTCRNYFPPAAPGSDSCHPISLIFKYGKEGTSPFRSSPRVSPFKTNIKTSFH